MRILALDIATRFGYAVWNSVGGLEASGFGQLPVDSLVPGKRYAAFHLALRKLAPEADLVAYEDAWHQQGKAGAVYHGLLAMVQVHAYQLKAGLLAVPVATVKKHTTGDGHADKMDMMRAAKRRWNLEPQTDDHADALGVLSYAVWRQGGNASKAPEAAPAAATSEGSARRVRRLRK